MASAKGQEALSVVVRLRPWSEKEKVGKSSYDGRIVLSRGVSVLRECKAVDRETKKFEELLQ
jgi:hypothetical protein